MNAHKTASPPLRPHSVPAQVEYHRVLAGDQRRVGRGILAIVLLVGGMFAFITAFSFLAGLIEPMLPAGASRDVGAGLTPVRHAAGLLAVGLLIPWSMFIQRFLYGVPGASLSSVVSRFRFGLVGPAVLFLGPAIALTLLLHEHVKPTESSADWSRSDILWMLVISLLLLPLQSAGEEYGIRGLVFRVAAGWGRGPRVSLILGIGVSAAVFAVVHIAGDPWWWVMYFALSVSTAVITWRTGGIEVAVVMHACYNTLTFLFWVALQADLAVAFDRSPGALNAALVIAPCTVFLGAAVVVWFRTRRTGPALTPPA